MSELNPEHEEGDDARDNHRRDRSANFQDAHLTGTESHRLDERYAAQDVDPRLVVFTPHRVANFGIGLRRLSLKLSPAPLIFGHLSNGVGSGLLIALSPDFRQQLDFSLVAELGRAGADHLSYDFAGYAQISADRLDRLPFSRERSTNLCNRLHDQHSNLGFQDVIRRAIFERRLTLWRRRVCECEECTGAVVLELV
jgi:hypothetical protein